MARALVSAKGSIVIPQEIREKYGIHASSQVEVLDIGGQVMIFPIPKDPIRAARGMLKFRGSALQALRATRREEIEREKAEQKKL